MPRPLSLPALYKKLDRLTLEQQQDLLLWLQRQILQRQLAAQTIPLKSGREIVEQQGCYRLEFVKCGKPFCHCATGQGHGPYWYKYWREGDRVKCDYIGKKLPEEH